MSFTAADFLPKWSTFVTANAVSEIRSALSEAEANIERIASQHPSQATYESSYLALENATESLARGWGRLQHLDSVCDNPAQREAISELLPEVTNFYSALSLNPRLFEVLNTVARGAGLEKPSDAPIIQRHIQETLADFIESGAALAETEKNRIAAIDSELSQLTKKYSENVLDATNAWDMVVHDEAKLEGLPESAKASAAANAQSKGIAAPAWRFTLQGPSMFPIMQYAHDSELRKTVWQASVSVGSQAPHNNAELVWKILKLRQEKATILGHKNFADLTLQRRMARDGETALAFIEGIHAKVRAPFLEDAEKLSHYKASKTNSAPTILDPWEFAYWAERQRKEHFDIDDEDLRPYFPVNRVMAGMFEIATQLFGITIKTATAETWHPEVTFYEIHDSRTAQHLGSFYADWHPRETKRGGAWMNCLHTGKQGEPHLGLIIGNMSPPIGDAPALLAHREVETIFHEFGHLLHGLLSDVPIKSLAGTSVAWDFVELPSQIMENFCWERESLDLFARHHLTEEPIPEELFQKMLAAKNYMSATAFMRQIALGKLDLELHYHLDAYEGRDIDEIDREILADYRTPSPVKSPSMALRFNHLFSSPTGYAAGYYSYKWAEVLDADAFSRFKNEGILNSATGMDFREKILSQGNSQPPDFLFQNFMSRPADPLALLNRAGLA